MQKLILLVCFSFTSLFVKSQSDTVITFSHVNIVQDLSKQKIYEKIKLWSTSAFKSVSGAIQLDDRESGLLAFDASSKVLSPNAPKTDDIYKQIAYYYSYTFKFKIQIRDGKYKVDISDIKFQQMGGEQYPLTSISKAPYKYMFSKKDKADKEWEDLKFTFKDFASNLFLSLDKEVSKKEDW